jgi:hypothetical protein
MAVMWTGNRINVNHGILWSRRSRERI